MTIRASAPGKLMVAGEYAVLDGAPAIVMAAQARVEVELVSSDLGEGIARGLSDAQPRFPEGVLARSVAERRLGTIDGHLHVNVDALRKSGQKLGLGSSAGTAAAAAGIVHIAHGRVLDEVILHEVFADALEGHASIAPNGSGADVAAAVYGGTLRFERGVAAPFVQRLQWPEGLAMRVVWTGKAASTAKFVARVREFQGESSSHYDDVMSALTRSAVGFVDAFSRTSADVVDAARDYHRRMKALGEAASLPIVESSLDAIAGLAEHCGGAAKPSGAGGGDVALAFFATQCALQEFEELAQMKGFDVLELELAGPGVIGASV